MGLEIEYTGDDGRKYNSLEEMMKAETEKLLDDRVIAIERAVSSQRCSLHGQNASAVVRRSGDQISFDITGCCDTLAEAAHQAAATAAAQ